MTDMLFHVSNVSRQTADSGSAGQRAEPYPIKADIKLETATTRVASGVLYK